MIVSLDTNIVIYAVESHPTFGVRAQTRLASALAAGDTLMISDLVRMECLVLPLRVGDAVLQKQYRTFFARPEVQVVPITGAVCDRAASIRAMYNLRAMDSLQLAAAVEHGASLFLTADARLNTFTGLTVEVLK
ncbi:MAG: PIN domain-containing protein [Planctomycetes bacterium]|nr:PIN domain-containing protein [Planctomycetota bacterium]